MAAEGGWRARRWTLGRARVEEERTMAPPLRRRARTLSITCPAGGGRRAAPGRRRGGARHRRDRWHSRRDPLIRPRRSSRAPGQGSRRPRLHRAPLMGGERHHQVTGGQITEPWPAGGPQPGEPPVAQKPGGHPCRSPTAHYQVNPGAVDEVKVAIVELVETRPSINPAPGTTRVAAGERPDQVRSPLRVRRRGGARAHGTSAAVRKFEEVDQPGSPPVPSSSPTTSRSPRTRAGSVRQCSAPARPGYRNRHSERSWLRA